MIRVAAKADGSTTHLDEVTGAAQALPTGFTMRTLFVPTATGAISTSASITPLSEMAVAAAQGATGGVTAANAAQAISTVTQLLGFNPTSVTPTSVAAAEGDQQKQMAIMLTAVSQLAASGALGCTAGTDGDQVKCVVDALAQSVKSDSIKLSTAGTDVSGALAAAVTTVLTTPSLSGTVSPATLTTVLANLACTTSCAAAPAGTSTTPTPPSPAAVAIAAAKLLFTEIRSDFTAMFSRASATSPAAVNAEALKFQAAMKGVQVPAISMVKDLGALLMGIDLYHDFMSGRTTLNTRSRAADSVASDDGTMLNSVGCTLYTDNTTSVVATTVAQVGAIGCSANYYAATVAGVTTRWRHGFTITRNADGTFSYTTRARQTNSTNTVNLSLSGPFAGTMTPTLDVPNGRIVGFAVTGDLAASFKLDTNVLANHHQSWNMQGTRTISGFKQEISTLAGSVISYSADTVVAGTLTVKSGQSTEIPVTADGSKPSATAPATQGEIATLSLNLTWATAGAELEGVLAATDSVWDKSLGYHVPSKLTLSGALRNIEAGVTTEFIKGVFTATLTGYENYDASSALDDSASNFYTIGGSFVGTVTAPNRPKLEITLGASSKSFEDLSELTLQYRTFVDGSPRMVIGVNASRQADGSNLITLTEATSTLSLALASGASTASLTRGGGEVVGTLNRSTNLLTFSDGSFVSLDLGL